ncbi:phosphopantetheine-binding protein [Candidatus Cyanaurora vandensis]|uniref:phosphopantetheine-binding protein n=1 Tax=Candidatus Cyanaurora vandensis TaxID=2714958 RepID=UPI00257E981A|nr:phosphopantetheine-binding protein [Candidatus Cyanaurora vandensis]
MITTLLPVKAEIVTKLIDIVQDLLSLEDRTLLNEQTRLREDLAIDSLGVVDFVVALEDNFSIKLPSTFNVEKIHTLSDAADLVLQLMEAPHA